MTAERGVESSSRHPDRQALPSANAAVPPLLLRRCTVREGGTCTRPSSEAPTTGRRLDSDFTWLKGWVWSGFSRLPRCCFTASDFDAAVTPAERRRVSSVRVRVVFT
jgi:hypothetical protein